MEVTVTGVWCVEIVAPKGGFSESGRYIFVLSNVCAFVLTWCLFVGNSRQTTSSVPWHRAPKYERKLNSHLTLKRLLLKWALVLCMQRKEVCAPSRETTVWLQEGGKTSESDSFPGRTAVESTNINPKTFLSDTRLWVLLDGQTFLCCLWSDFVLLLAPRIKPEPPPIPPFPFSFLYISITGPYLANQHMVLINHYKAD